MAMRGTRVTQAELHGGEDMPVEGVDATEPEQAHHVQRAARPLHVRAQLHERLERVEGTVGDAPGNADDVLRDDPAGAEVQVSHLGVAHLPFGEADGQSARVEQGARPCRPEAVPDRGFAQLDRVRLAFGPVAPPVEHDQRDRGLAAKSV
jgi:hypothetical protein